jgi:hypothetical protein
MPERQLDLQVMHRSRRADQGKFQAAGDPRDAAWLRSQLRSWLEGHRWHPDRWNEFEIVARQAGRYTPLARVRAS